MNIGYIEGTVVLVSGTTVVVQTASGVGYCVTVPATSIHQLGLEAAVALFVFTIFKEDSTTLYGFMFYQELIWFRSIIKVSGIGPKIAMSVISAIGIEELERAIQEESPEALCAVPGLGKKTAQRITTELKTECLKNTKEILSAQLPSSSQRPLLQNQAQSQAQSTQGIDPPKESKKDTKKTNNSKKSPEATPEGRTILRDTISAIKNLGFNEMEAVAASSKIVRQNPKLSIKQLIPIVLKELAPKDR